MLLDLCRRTRGADMTDQHHDQYGDGKWLLFFYSVPSKPTSSRMKIWRMLLRTGAMHFKGSVYILPCTDHHYEFFHWLVATVQDLRGEAAFVKVEKVESMKNEDIIRMFNGSRAKDYDDIEKKLDDLEKRVRR